MRLFAGVELDTATRDGCVRVQDCLRGAGLDAAYEAAEKLHITLAFLGRVDALRLPEVEPVLDEIAGTTQCFSLALDRLGAFPHERRPRVIYVGSRAQGAPFRTLATNLRDRYTRLGFTFEDDVVAHVTIARVRGGAPRPVPLLDVAPMQLQIERLALFESLPDQRTTRYVVRHTSALAQ